MRLIPRGDAILDHRLQHPLEGDEAQEWRPYIARARVRRRITHTSREARAPVRGFCVFSQQLLVLNLVAAAASPQATASRGLFLRGRPGHAGHDPLQEEGSSTEEHVSLVGDVRKKVRAVSPAGAAIYAAVAWSHPRSEYRASAASGSLPRRSGCRQSIT